MKICKTRIYFALIVLNLANCLCFDIEHNASQDYMPSDLKYTFVDDSNDSQQLKNIDTKINFQPILGKEKAESSSTIQNIKIPDSKTPDFEYDFNEAAEMPPENILSGYTPRSASFSELEKNQEKLGEPAQMKSSDEPIANQSSPIANLSRQVHLAPPNGTKRISRPKMNTGRGIIGKLQLATEKLLNTSLSKKYLQFLNRVYGTSLWTYITIFFSTVYKANKDLAIFIYKGLWKILRVKDSMQLMKSHIAIMQFLVSFMGVTAICKIIGGLFYVYKMSLILLDSRNHLQRNN